jgi:hypothetical protein
MKRRFQFSGFVLYFYERIYSSQYFVVNSGCVPLKMYWFYFGKFLFTAPMSHSHAWSGLLHDYIAQNFKKL